ncbi:succinate semialdehyde dehydrogenase [Escherichia coli SHECO001]|nr:succinate-semialdehyde dehydrogenase [Escherichia coli]OSK01953.1 succinate semialdehyde dehydrogenase [Escherichia coli SHECO001]
MTITPATHAISINPATGEQLSVLPWAGANDIENALQLAAAGFRDWRETNIDYRAEKLRGIGKALRARSEEMAQMITREMGKPINQARAEVAKSANLCDWYAEHGPAMLKAEPTLVENQQAVIEYRPLGTILAIMPWNFPLWQVMRGAVPIILAGNGYLLKHAPNVMGCAQLIAQVFKDAGIPQGVYGWLNADNDGVSQMIKDSRIAAVTVTGSVRAGAAIGAQAGAALKKCVLELGGSDPFIVLNDADLELAVFFFVLELGGSDPFIVLNDADLELAVKAAVAGRYQNTGQVCAAAKRFIIEEGIASAFTERFVAAAAALKMGDPRDEENALGPMARFDLRDELHHQVEKTLAQGARLLLGGEKMAGAGNYYPPTVLANVTPEMTAFREEMFGPVAAITVAKDAEHALELANDSEFGLSATIFTTDETQARQMAARLECGGVFINGYCASDARVAFGGVKKSGFGRELSHFGLHEFCNIQTVWKDRI